MDVQSGATGAQPAGVEPFDRRVIAVGGVVVAVLIALSTRYGFHRDELYFLDCARHLQASYVDQPVLAPLLTRLSLALFGLSVTGLRLWPALAAGVTVVVGGLPPSQRAGAVIFTADYSEAAAINELGAGTGMPTAVSAHNSYWWWGPGNPRATTVVAVVPGPDAAPGAARYLCRFFTGVRDAATLSNPYGVRNIESGGHVYVCTGMRGTWAGLWPQLRHYD